MQNPPLIWDLPTIDGWPKRGWLYAYIDKITLWVLYCIIHYTTPKLRNISPSEPFNFRKKLKNKPPPGGEKQHQSLRQFPAKYHPQNTIQRVVYFAYIEATLMQNSTLIKGVVFFITPIFWRSLNAWLITVGVVNCNFTEFTQFFFSVWRGPHTSWLLLFWFVFPPIQGQ